MMMLALLPAVFAQPAVPATPPSLIGFGPWSVTCAASASSLSRSSRRVSRPASVRATPRPARVTSFSPRSSVSFCNWWLTALWVRLSSSAARVIEPCRATTTKVCRIRILMLGRSVMLVPECRPASCCWGWQSGS